jgi:hypothetical protein
MLRGLQTLALASLLGSCGPKNHIAELAPGEREIIELGYLLALLKTRLEARAPAAATETLGELDGQLQQLADLRRKLERQSQTLRADVDAMADGFESFRIAVLHECRRAATGLALDRMTVKNGREFEDVSVIGIEDYGVSIRHRYGVATLRYNQLTSEQQVRFGMDEGLARLAEKRQYEAALAWHKQAQRESPAKPERSDTGYRATPSRNPASLAAATPARRSSPLAEPARQFGSGSIYRYYRTRYRPVFYYTPYQPCQNPARHAAIYPNSWVWPQCGK